MAKEALVRSKCDRCKRVYSEAAPQQAASATPPPTIHLEFTPAGEDKPVRKTVSFADLCPKCHSRVGDLVEQLELAKDDDKETKTETKVDPKTDPAPAPKGETNPKPLDPAIKAADNKGTPPAQGKN